MRYTEWMKGSAYTGRLPTGCRHCARGGKLVLLVTGICGSGCYYCPLSDKKRGKAVVYADELLSKADSDIIGEAKLIGATGTGVTGGDPLIVPKETARLIRLLKGEFGSKHHIHLYTSSSDLKAIGAVAKAGLDEIRFHPPVPLWGKMAGSRYEGALLSAVDLGMEVGFEIPSLPGSEAGIRSLVDSASRLGLSYVNMNELEFSETNWRQLKSRGFEVKDDVSAAVKGSEKLALKILGDSECAIPLHYCSSSFKDAIQLRRRISRRARNVKRPFDVLTKDGTRLIGIVETKNPVAAVKHMHDSLGIPLRLMEANKGMRRVEIAPWILEKIFSEVEGRSFIIEEYPTADRLEVEREPLAVKRR